MQAVPEFSEFGEIQITSRKRRAGTVQHRPSLRKESGCRLFLNVIFFYNLLHILFESKEQEVKIIMKKGTPKYDLNNLFQMADEPNRYASS